MPAEAHFIELLQGVAGTTAAALEQRRDRQGLTAVDDYAAWQHAAFVEGFVFLAPPPAPGSAAQGAPQAHRLLEIGGLRQSLYGGEVTRYNPLSKGIYLATADYWQSGTFRRLGDARAKLSQIKMEIAARTRARVRLEGFYSEIGESDLPEPRPPADAGPIARAATAKARVITATGALPVRAKSLELDLRAALQIKDYTGYREHAYADRRPVWTLTIARPALADFDPWWLRKSKTAIAMRMWTEHQGGRCVEIGARGLIRDIAEISIDGDYGLALSGPCIATRPGGNECWVAFGSAAVLAADYYDDIEALGGPEQLRAAGNLLHQVMNVDYPMTLGAA